MEMRRIHKLASVLGMGVVLGALAGLAPARADGPKPAPHVWEGVLTIGSGAKVRIVFNVTPDPAGGFKASFDSPDQGAKGLKVNAVTLDKSKLVFDMGGLGMRYEGTLNDAATESVGHWIQGGAKLPLTLAKKEKASGAPEFVGPQQVWEGKIEIQAGLGLRIAIHVGKLKDGTLAATMDSLDQGAKGIKIDSVTLDKGVFRFEVKSIFGKYEGKFNEAGTEAKGTWTQGPNKLPLTLKKVDKVSELRRPQTPKPPFPYQAVDVSYPNKAGGITLAATLTVPQGKGPFPAVILISGSGAQDRDETLFEHKPFAVIADTLTRRGVAVLRVDDRGVGGSGGSTSKSTTDDFAGDVLAGVAFLKTRPEVDATKIGLLGHSEGGIIAPLVASRSKDVAFIVLLAGTGLPGDEILALQSRLIGLAMVGKDSEKQEKLLKTLEFNKRIIAVAKSEADDKAAETKIKAIGEELKASLSEDERKALGEMGGQIEGQLKTIRSPWFRYFLTYDPRPALAKVSCPVLAVIGEKDLQVPPKENLTEIEKALKAGGNSCATLKTLPGLNHLFQTCTTGAPAEYAQIEETMAPLALKEIGDWVVGRSVAK